MMPSSDASYFKYARAASTVKVDHVPKGGGREIVDLLKNVIGPIRNVDFRGDGTSMEITFSNPDDAIKSLCLSGYAVSGHPIVVTLRLPPKPRAAIPAKFPDTRRNLYVLGLPFDLTENELSSIFSRFGTVTHSVILATVDNASRRRGFVVMSKHAEAKAAIDNISQTSVRGSIIDVSWAVVQRSQGFLDGGDRAVALEGQVDSAPPSSDRGTTPFKPSSAFSDNSKTISSLPGAQPYPTSIIVHNLPALLFARDSDLEPLFFPFGEVKEIRKQGASAAQSRADTISVLVTYSSVTGAREAKVALHGQTYGDIPLIVESFPPYHHDFNKKPGREQHLSRSSLNPRASPFIFHTALAVSAPPTCHVSGDFPDYFSKPTSSALATPFDHYSSHLASQGHRSLPSSSHPSRTSSATPWSIPLARQSSMQLATPLRT